MDWEEKEWEGVKEERYRGVPRSLRVVAIEGSGLQAVTRVSTEFHS